MFTEEFLQKQIINIINIMLSYSNMKISFYIKHPHNAPLVTPFLHEFISLYDGKANIVKHLSKHRLRDALIIITPIINNNNINYIDYHYTSINKIHPNQTKPYNCLQIFIKRG